MNERVNELSVKDKEQLVRHLRAAVFYQTQLSSTASYIRESLSTCHEADWDTEYQLKQIRLEFGERIVTDEDVQRFVSDLQDNQFPQSQSFRGLLDEQTKAIVRKKLQKAVWIQNELWKAAGLIAETLHERTADLVVDVEEFSAISDSGCELVESDLDLFLGIAPPGATKQGRPVYWEQQETH
jgi:hypothetical protein